jgi:hypothetical protein
VLPGGKIFTEVDPSTDDTTNENNSTDNIGIITKYARLLFKP